MSRYKNKQISRYKVYKKNTYEEGTPAMDEAKIEDNFSDYKELNPEQEKIAGWLEKLKFRKQVVGGVDEYDVWKKIVELNAMYEEALKAERIRCDVIINYYKDISMVKEVEPEREKVENE